MVEWEGLLILLHGNYINRTLFLMPTDVSLWDVNPTAELTILEGSGLVLGRLD